MRIGIMGDPWGATLETLEEEVQLLDAAGGSTYWLTQVWRYDALTLVPSLSLKAPGLEFASGVVASYLRHPMTLASQALTANALTKGKFTLNESRICRLRREPITKIQRGLRLRL